MQRRTISVVAGTALLGLILAGCSNNPSASGDGQVLTLTTTTDYKAAYEALGADFEAANPGVTVNMEFSGDAQGVVLPQLQGGAGPDLIPTQPATSTENPGIGVAYLASAGYLADLSDQAWAKDVPDTFRYGVSYKDATYAYPGVLQPLGAFYNTQAVKAAGLSAPTTKSEVLKFCADAKAAGKIAYSLGYQDIWVAQMVPLALSAQTVYSKDRDWDSKLADGSATFPDSGWLTSMEQVQEMQDAGCFTPDPNGVNLDAQLTAVAAGDALGVAHVGGVFGNMLSKNKDADYILEPLPASDNPDERAFTADLGIGIGVNANSKNKELAVKFIDFMAQPENINKFATNLASVIPAINNGFKAPDVVSTFTEFVQEGQVVPFPQYAGPVTKIQEAMIAGLQNMSLGTESPRAVVDRMQAAFDAG